MHRIVRWAASATISLALTVGVAAAADVTGIGDRELVGANAVAGGTSIPDLRKSVLPYEGFNEVVRSGVREKLGMPNFGGRLAEADTKLIRRYLDARRSSTP